MVHHWHDCKSACNAKITQKMTSGLSRYIPFWMYEILTNNLPNGLSTETTRSRNKIQTNVAFTLIRFLLIYVMKSNYVNRRDFTTVFINKDSVPSSYTGSKARRQLRFCPRVGCVSVCSLTLRTLRCRLEVQSFRKMCKDLFNCVLCFELNTALN